MNPAPAHALARSLLLRTAAERRSLIGTGDENGTDMPKQRELRAAMVPDDTGLAWALAETARPNLSTAEASSIHIAIGIGEQFAAIDTLVGAIARQHLRLDPALLATLTAWLDCYVGQDAEPRLRTLLAEVTVDDHSVQQSARPSSRSSA